MKFARILLSAASLFWPLVAAQAQTQSAGSQPAAAVVESATPGQTATLQRETTANPALLTVIDTSGTVRKTLPQLKQVAHDILAAAPDNSRFGVVTVNTEALKRIYESRDEALTHIDTLKAARGGFTDLNRATDAALALAQGEAGPTVIVYLTDGVVDVPTTFEDKSDFITVLRREFTPRPNIRVIVLNVNKGQLPKGVETLPPNVSFLALKDWLAARAEVANMLGTTIKQQLQPPAAPRPAPADVRSATQAPATLFGRTTLALAGLFVLAVVAAGAFYIRRRRRRRNTVEPDVMDESDRPENLLTAADLQAAETPVKAKAMPVVLLEVEERGDDYQEGVGQHIKVLPGDHLVIGKQPIASDLPFPELTQGQTLELRLEQESERLVLKAFRLRPDIAGALDAVTVNRRPAIEIFKLQEGDRLGVGSVTLRVVFTDESLLTLLGGDDADDEEFELPPAATVPEHNGSSQVSPLLPHGSHVSLRRPQGPAHTRFDA